MNDEVTLRQIQERLGQRSALQVIEEVFPRSRDDALAWVRRLPLWEEYRGRHPAQAVAIARVISRRALRAFNLGLSEDGRVVGRHPEGRAGHTPKPAKVFPLAVAGEQVRVEYTPRYFPSSDLAHFSFESPHSPPQPHCLSETGCLSQFAWQDAVDACGGPEAYAALFAAARLAGKHKELAAVFEGTFPEAKKSGRKKPAPPVLGEHTAAVVQDRQREPEGTKPPEQGTLF